MNALLKAFLVAGALATSSTASVAQDYPSRQVTVVVPLSPGGTTDAIGRYLVDGLSKLWKQTVVVENRPGAGTAIGSAHVTQAKPDGYTLLFVSSSYALNAAIQKNLPFDPRKDLLPVGMAAIGDIVVITGSRVQIPNLNELQRQAKSQTIFYGTVGVGTNAHLGAQLLADILGVEMKPVHYKGGAEVMADVGGGRIDLFVGTMTDLLSGVGTPIAVMGKTRSAALPAVPTVVEAGFPNAQASWWGGIFVPAGTPNSVVLKLNQDIRTVMSTPEAISFLQKQGLMPSNMGAAEFATAVSDEINRWSGLAEKHKIRP